MRNKRRQERAGDAPRALGLTRRQSLKAIGGGIAGAVFAPAVLKGATAGKVFIRSTGGSVEEAYRKVWYEPFTKETGIEVVPVPATPAKIIAMVQSGNVTIDVPSTSAFQTFVLQREGALERLDYDKFKLANLSDLTAVDEYWVARSSYATILGYSKEAFPDKRPSNWAEVWDVKKFPGRRMLQDPSFGAIDLEQALLADGVPMDRLYPLDVDRAFKMLEQIKPHVVKWWDSGAVSAQMLADRVAVCGTIWDSRIINLIKKGAPLGIEWNQAMRNIQAMSITKGAPNRENAYKLTDYSLQPKIQAAVAREANVSPSNPRAFEFIEQIVGETLCTYPPHAKLGFNNDAKWWAENGARVAERFREFLLKG